MTDFKSIFRDNTWLIFLIAEKNMLGLGFPQKHSLYLLLLPPLQSTLLHAISPLPSSKQTFPLLLPISISKIFP